MDKFLSRKRTFDDNKASTSAQTSIVPKIKSRKYSQEYLNFGFTITEVNGEEKPLCVICSKILAADSMKPNKLKRHFETLHEGLSITEEESFIDFTSSGEIKGKFCNKTLVQFWAEVDDEFSELKTKAFRILLPFSTSYLCETEFSAVAALKTKYRSQLNIEKELRVSISNIKPSFENLCSITHKIHLGQLILQSAQYAYPYIIKLIYMGEKQQKNIIYNFPKRKVDGVKHTSKFEGQRDDNQKYYSRGYKKRPSTTIDSACSSGGVALWTAYHSLKNNSCDAAVVTGCQLNLHPIMLKGYIGSGIVATTGNSRPFDAITDGIIRTESISALFVQKAKTARRAYATLSSVLFYSGGFLPEGIHVPSAPMLQQIISDALEEANVDYNEIEYVEAHGAGTQAGDQIEANALGQIFCKNRKKPLLIGTIKCNIGDTEASSAICGIIKSLIAFETNLIPPNIKYETPNLTAPDLVEGRLKVVTEPTTLNSDYIPVNSVGYGGTLVETILKRNPITKENRERTKVNISRLVLYPATTEEGVNFVFEYIQNNPDLPDEFFALLHNLSFCAPMDKPYRGYALCQEGKNPVIEIKNASSNKRQIWYVMTGMGCQWPGMGLDHMKIDVFAESMHRSAEILKPFGIDLFGLLKGGIKDDHDNRKITVSFVTICAIQIALVELLKHLDINPDGMVGHSTGELLCAYADGCLTHEQTLISSYYRGQTVENSNLPQGGMAAVGLSWSQAQKICPEGIYPACDNATDSVTISGEKEPLEKFVEKLKQENIFVRLVNSHGYGFHCKHVHAAAPALKKAQEKLVPSPKLRSKRWVSSSYIESEWDNPDCKMASAEYFVHNLTSSVHFNDAIQKIPSDAIVIEIGPHFLLQSILKRSVGTMASYFGLMKRNEVNNVDFLMELLGKLYNEGVDPKIERLYPPVKFPVPRGIPSISDLIKWNHSQSYIVPKYTAETSEFSMEFKFDKEDAYILDHKIDGRSLFPATGYIYLAWKVLATKLKKNFQEMPVVIENFKIHRATVITAQALTKFFVNVLDSSGRFEIKEDRSIVASGKVYEGKKLTFQQSPPEYNSSDLFVSASDIYDELKRSGYEYGPCFQGLVESNMDGTAGLVQWKGQWIPFLDALLLFFGIIANEEGFYLPTGALSFKIDPNVLINAVQSRGSSEIEDVNNCSQNLPVKFNQNTKTCRTVGVEITKLIVEPASNRRKDENPTYEKYAFVPYESIYTPTSEASLQLSKYFNACNIFMDKIGKTLRKDTKQYQFLDVIDDMFCLEEYVEKITENQHLLKVLKQSIDNENILKEKRKDWFLSYSRFAGRDMLNNSLLNEDSLRIMLEIISENTFRKLNVLEINRNFPVSLIPATEIMQKYSHLRFKKSTLVASNMDSFNQEALDEHSIQVKTEESLTDIASEKAQDVAISSFACGPISELENLLQTLISVIKSDGFILLFYKERANSAELFLSSLCGEKLHVQSQELLEKILKAKNLVILSKISDPFGSSLYLLRSPSPITASKVVFITEDSYNWVDKVKDELFEKKSGIVWLVSKDSPSNGIVGMVNCLKQEPGGERIRSIFMSQKKQENNISTFSLENPFYQHLVTKNLIMNVWRNGSWGSFRHILIRETKVPRPVEYSYVNCRRYGDLSSFEWIESNVKYVQQKNKKLIHIYNSALNFRDVMLATGKLSIDTAKPDTTRALQRTNRGSGAAMEESENDVGNLEQLLIYADEHYIPGKLPLGDHLGKVLHEVEEYHQRNCFPHSSLNCN
ncbi:fatty acid synthase [Trichonephila clavipes]|nr:fatty acid synthase [Trichonephila clavipes]